MAIKNIPVEPIIAQRFSIVLDSVSYDMFVSYNTRVGYWTATIEQKGEVLVSGMSLVGGVDLVQQYVFELKNLWTVNVTDSKKDATANDLGVAVLFLFIDQTTMDSISDPNVSATDIARGT